MTANPAGVAYVRRVQGMGMFNVYVWYRGPGGAPWRWNIDGWADDGFGGQLHGGATTRRGALRGAARKLRMVKRLRGV